MVCSTTKEAYHLQTLLLYILLNIQYAITTSKLLLYLKVILFLFSQRKWLSICHHVSNIHQWGSNKLFHSCEYTEAAQVTDKAWLKKNSEGFKSLQKVVFDKKLLADLQQLNGFCHTGTLETYHSMMTKYIPKRIHFSYEGM